MTKILTGLREIAPQHDALVCDVWGVLHNGHSAFAAACAALKTFKDNHGPVILLTNAPRPVKDVEQMFAKYGVPLDCYDMIVTSGVATRDDLERRTKSGLLAMLHLGPERDGGIFVGLNINTVDVDEAQIVLCSGLYDDDTETPADYAELLAKMKARNLTMICANPDWLVQRGGKLVYCAGAVANEYEKIGGRVIYYGKPKTAIYDYVRAAMKGAKNPLAIGDGMHTDIKGANAAGMEALFIADGVHGEDVRELTERHIADLFAEAGVHAKATMRALVW
ncbi:MAG: TIGR01459 family HAD-type hydrolase [Proteobacteria bacterium]|nr:TIGR01459 family HAD-type hydrolase [Pseudomonadota bacterium]